MLSLNLSILGDIHLQIFKTQNGWQNVKKHPYFICFFAHEARLMVSARFLLSIFFLVSLKRNNLYLTFTFKISVVFYIFTVTDF